MAVNINCVHKRETSLVLHSTVICNELPTGSPLQCYGVRKCFSCISLTLKRLLKRSICNSDGDEIFFRFLLGVWVLLVDGTLVLFSYAEAVPPPPLIATPLSKLQWA